MFRYPRVWPAFLAVAFIALSTCAFAQNGNPFAQGSAGPQRQPAQQAVNPAQKHFMAGLQLMQQRKVDAAITEFQAARKIDPKQPAVLINLGMCYMQKQKFSTAEMYLKQAIAQDPKGNSPQTRFAQARLCGILMAQNKGSEALPLAKKLAAANPKDYDAQAMLGSLYMQSKNFSAAAGAFKSALAIKPNDKGSLYNLGIALLDAKRFAEARQVLEKSLKIADDPQTRGLVGYICEQMGDKTAALAHYDKIAWKHVPQSSAAIMSIIRIYTAMGKTDKSIEVLKKAAAADKNNYDINMNLGRLYYVKKDYKQAETYYLAARKARSDAFVNLNLALCCLNMQSKTKEVQTYAQTAVKLDPKNKQAIDVYAYVLQNNQKTDAAIAQYQKWEQYYPTDPTPNVKIATMLMMQNKGDEAYGEYQKAMRKAPGDPPTLVSAAGCLQSLKRYDEATALLQKVLAKNPKSEPARGCLAEIYESQNKTDEAIVQYKKILEANSKSSMAIQRLASAYDKKKDYKSEIETDRKLCALNSKDTQTPLQIARLYQKMGQLDKGIAEIKKFADANPKDTDARALYGDLLVENKDWAGARTQYGELIKNEKAPVKSYGYFLTAGSYDKEGKPDEAIAAYKSCLADSPANMEALDALKKAYTDQKKPDEFYTYLKTTVEAGTDKAPYDYFWTTCKDAKKSDEGLKTLEDLGAKFADKAAIHGALAQAYADTGAKDKAVEQYKSILAKDKKAFWAQGALGDLYKDMNKDNEAIACYVAYLKEGIFDTKRHIALGDVYTKLGKKQEAIAAYQQALKFQPTNPEALGKLDALQKPAPEPPQPGPLRQPAPSAGSPSLPLSLGN